MFHCSNNPPCLSLYEPSKMIVHYPISYFLIQAVEGSGDNVSDEITDRLEQLEKQALRVCIDLLLSIFIVANHILLNSDEQI